MALVKTEEIEAAAAQVKEILARIPRNQIPDMLALATQDFAEIKVTLQEFEKDAHEITEDVDSLVKRAFATLDKFDTLLDAASGVAKAGSITITFNK